MNLVELKKRVAEVLGVSASQDELAFEVFTEHVAEILTDGITLKVPRIGFFQLKNTSQKINKTSQLLFSALPEDLTKEARTLYLTIDITKRSNNSFDFDSHVFSIGVGKPLLPLLDNEHDSETSFAILRKSIEERVKELIAESDQIPNFNIWEESFLDNEKICDKEASISQQLLELTEDYHLPQFEVIEKQNEPNTTEEFLSSLLSQNKFEVTDDFSNDKLNDQSKNETIKIDIPPVFDDELFSIKDGSTTPELSIKDLLDDKNEITETNIDQNIDAELLQSDISKTNQEEDSSFKEILVNEMNSLEETENLQLDTLLTDEEPTVPQENEISIEPPTSSKYLLFEQIEDGTTTGNSVGNWNIEHEHLQEIVEEELQEYDSEKIANENSNLLHKLLNDIKNEADKTITPIQLNLEQNIYQPQIEIIEEKSEVASVDTTPNQDYTNDALEKTSTDEEVDDESSIEKIEWNWGDELKEEFGLGTEEKFNFPNSSSNHHLVIDSKIVQSNNNEDRIKNDSDLLTNIANEYTTEKESELPAEFDLRKTRIDLFTKLEQTLEREVNFLREEYVKPTSPEIKKEAPVSKVVDDVNVNTEPQVDFKDEKVFLDFKTPPPKYEFYEEKNEPVLTKPKRITILLSPEEHLLNSSGPLQGPEETFDTENEVIEKKTKAKYLIAAIAVVVIVVISVGITYWIMSSKQSPNSYTTNEGLTNKVVDEQIQKTIIGPHSNGATNSEIDEFSDFPRTATPPVPVTSGSDINSLNIPNSNNKSEVASQATKKVILPSNLEKKNVSQSTNGIAIEKKDISINNMIFSDGKSYNVQHSSWRRKDLAERTVEQLRKQGFNAFMVEAFLPEKGGTWYRVRIGSFKSEQEAAEFKNKNNF